MEFDLNKMFEEKMQWVYDNGVIYITGRDIFVIILGFFIGIAFVLFIISIKCYFEERKRC